MFVGSNPKNHVLFQRIMCFLPLHKMPQSETKEAIATNGNDVDDLESFERPR
jgi:hypothetical protein